MASIALSIPGIYVPPREEANIVTNADLESIVDTTDEWIVSNTGIRERRISHNVNVRSMAVHAVQDLLRKTGCRPEEIDEIIFATNSHDGQQEFPAHAGYVGREIGARNFPLYDVGAGCTGLIFGIRNAYNALVAEQHKRKIIVVGSERLSNITDYSDRNTCILFGDGAGAYIVEKHAENDGEGIIKNAVGGTPDTGDEEWRKGYLALEWKTGKKIRPGKDVKNKFELYEEAQDYLIMKGQKVFRFAAPAMSHAVHEVLKGTKYTLEDIDVIIPHGANMRIINAAKEKLMEKGFKGRIFTNLEFYGNTSTASIPIAAEEAIRTGILKKGDLYVLVGFGAGLTWGASLVRHQ